jgi:hypothetical protein
MRRFLWLTLAMTVLPALASAQTIEGAWRLAEYSSDGGETVRNAESLMIIAGGHYSRLFVRTNETRETPTTDTERVAVWEPFVANSGTYTVSGSTFTFTPVVAKMPSASRSPVTLQFTVNGNELVLTGNAEGATDTMQRWVRVGGM